MDILKQISEAIQIGDDEKVFELTKQSLQENIPPKTTTPTTFSSTIEEIANWCGEKVSMVKDILTDFSEGGKLQLYEDRIVVLNLYEMFRVVKNKRQAQKKVE